MSQKSRRSIPSIQALRAFDAAARHLHFANAANELRVSPGAVSRQIQALENMLGTTLFVREHTGVQLTEDGKRYAYDVAAALDRLAIASYRIKATAQRRPLSLCAYPTFAMRWLIPKWQKFQQLHPNIELQLTTALKPPDSLDNEYDAVIRYLPDAPTDQSYITLAPGDIFPVCSAEIGRKLHKVEDIFDHVLIQAGTRPNDWQRWLDAHGIEQAHTNFKKAQFESLGLAYQAAIDGMGLAMGIGCLVQDDIARSALIQPFEFVYRPLGSFYFVYSADSVDHRLQFLIEFLKENSDV